MALIGKELMLLWPLLILERIQACSTVERLFHKMYVLKKKIILKIIIDIKPIGFIICLRLVA